MLLQQLINGLMLGAAYSLVAIGYSLVFGVLKLVHLAHGEVFMIGAFIGLQSVLWFNVPPIVAIFIAAAGSAVLGMVLEFAAFRRIRHTGGHFLAPMVSTIGVALILQEIATKIFGAEPTGFPHAEAPAVWQLGPVQVSSIQIFILAVSLVCMYGLHILVTHTRFGMAMRAVSENPVTAATLGINPDNVILFTFAVASALGGVAGVLLGLSFNSISPFIGIDMGIKGMAVMLIGGLGNIYGAMLGGLLLGAVEVMSVAYLASSYRDAFSFALMIAIIMWRPQGLFGSSYHVENRS
ncbi:MAG: branched-chain amino acid ABC transporter permease [Betaproteobacteria bacterium]|nr:branched-chain amino acid ABC transporter permease [Betaproteobacteria bacterium]